MSKISEIKTDTTFFNELDEQAVIALYRQHHNRPESDDRPYFVISLPTPAPGPDQLIITRDCPATNLSRRWLTNGRMGNGMFALGAYPTESDAMNMIRHLCATRPNDYYQMIDDDRQLVAAWRTYDERNGCSDCADNPFGEE